MRQAGSLLLKRAGRSATITLGRAVARPSDMWSELVQVCDELAADDDLSAVVITGGFDYPPVTQASARAESAADLGPAVPLSAERRTWSRTNPVEAIASLPHVTVAVIEGEAVGIGLEIALACDLRFASHDARFSFPEVKYGLIPGAGATQRLPRIIGPARAAELILTGASVEGQKAHAIGLVHDVAAADVLQDRVRSIVETVGRSAPIALRYAKEALGRGADMSLEDALILEHDLYLLLQTTNDRLEGLAAYRERREPTFHGD